MITNIKEIRFVFVENQWYEKDFLENDRMYYLQKQINIIDAYISSSIWDSALYDGLFSI